MASWRCLGIDFSAKQLEMARSGAEELAVSDRVEYREQQHLDIQQWAFVSIG